MLKSKTMNKKENEIQNLQEFVAHSVIKHTSNFVSFKDYVETSFGIKFYECYNSNKKGCNEWFKTNSIHQYTCDTCKKIYCDKCKRYFLLDRHDLKTICISCLQKHDISSDSLCNSCNSSDYIKAIILSNIYTKEICIYCDKCKRILIR